MAYYLGLPSPWNTWNKADELLYKANWEIDVQSQRLNETLATVQDAARSVKEEAELITLGTKVGIFFGLVTAIWIITRN